MKRVCLVLSLVLASASPALAQQKKKPAVTPQTTAAAAPAPPPPVGTPITLTDAIRAAVKQNRTLLSAGFDVEIAEANIQAAEGANDLLLGLQGSVTRDVFVGDPLNPFSLARRTTTYAGAASLTKPFSFGGSVNLEFANTVTRGTVTIPGQGDVTSESWRPSVTLGVFQPLLRGFGDASTRAAAERRAEAARDVTLLERENVASTAVRDVIVAYWELRYAARDLEIRRNTLQVAREQLRITQARLDVGVGAPTDVAAVEQGVATREEEVLTAELAVSERALALRQITGMEISATAIDLNATDPMESPAREVAVDQALRGALSANAQIAAARARGRSAWIEVDVNERGLLPQLDLNASATTSGSAARANPAFDQLTGVDNYNLTAGVVFSVPLGNNTAQGNLAASRGQLRKVRMTEADITAQISVQVVRGVNLVRVTQKRLEVLQKAVRLAQVNLDAERARFEVGRSTNFDVLLRLDELAQSQLRLARAQADYLNALAALQTLTGEILPAHRIRITARR